MEFTKPRISSSQSMKLQSISQQQEQGSHYYAGRVIQAFKDDRLYIRIPNLTDDEVTPGIDHEFAYIKRKEHVACSATYIVQGGNTNTFKDNVGIVLVDPSILHFHKHDVSTPDYPRGRSPKQIDQYRAKLYCYPALDSEESSTKKIREMAQRSCSHYFSWTSGHLHQGGQFSQRKYRNTGQYYQSRPRYNEIVLNCIQEQNVVGVAGVGIKIFTANSSRKESLADMLLLRQKMASCLTSRPTLPLVFFSIAPVRLLDILDLESLGFTNEGVIAQLQKLYEYAVCVGMKVEQLGTLMARLPPSVMLARLMGLNLPQGSLIQSQAVELVSRSGKNGYWDKVDVQLPDISEFLDLVEKGADFRRSADIMFSYRVLAVPLVRICLFVGTWADSNKNVDGISKTLNPTELIKKREDAERLIADMVEHQLFEPTKNSSANRRPEL